MDRQEKPDFRTASLFVVLMAITVLFVLGAHLVLNVPSLRAPSASPVTAGFADTGRTPASEASTKDR